MSDHAKAEKMAADYVNRHTDSSIRKTEENAFLAGFRAAEAGMRGEVEKWKRSSEVWAGDSKKYFDELHAALEENARLESLVSSVRQMALYGEKFSGEIVQRIDESRPQPTGATQRKEHNHDTYGADGTCLWCNLRPVLSTQRKEGV